MDAKRAQEYAAQSRGHLVSRRLADCRVGWSGPSEGTPLLAYPTLRADLGSRVDGRRTSETVLRRWLVH